MRGVRNVDQRRARRCELDPEPLLRPERRHWLAAAATTLAAGVFAPRPAAAAPADQGSRPAPAVLIPIDSDAQPLTVHTFGDSVLDCGHYNAHGVDPGRLLVRNDDSLFPDFHGRDLQSRRPTRLDHRAVDGATVTGLRAQLEGVRFDGPGVALLSIGGNDLLHGLAGESGTDGLRAFALALQRFIAAMPVRPLLMATVYDPTFGDDRQNFLDVDARVARANHRRVNQMIAEQATASGAALVDLHGRFLLGDASWFTRTIEPSLHGASEVRRAFADALGLASRG